MENFTAPLIAIAGGILGLAIVATIVSKNAATSNVINAGAGALSSVIRAAVSPVSTAGTNGNLGNNTFSTPIQAGNIVGAALAGLQGQ